MGAGGGANFFFTDGKYLMHDCHEKGVFFRTGNEWMIQ